MSKRMSVVTSRGVLSFDGEVVETFGHGFDRPIRAHVAMLRKVELSEGGRFSLPSVEFDVRDQAVGPHAIFTEEEFANPEIVRVVDAIRAAAPDLEDS